MAQQQINNNNNNNNLYLSWLAIVRVAKVPCNPGMCPSV